MLIQLHGCFQIDLFKCHVVLLVDPTCQVVNGLQPFLLLFWRLFSTCSVVTFFAFFFSMFFFSPFLLLVVHNK